MADSRDSERITRPLREMGTPFLDLSGQMPWTTLQQAFDRFFPAGQRLYYFKSRYLKSLDDETDYGYLRLSIRA